MNLDGKSETGRGRIRERMKQREGERGMWVTQRGGEPERSWTRKMAKQREGIERMGGGGGGRKRNQRNQI